MNRLSYSLSFTKSLSGIGQYLVPCSRELPRETGKRRGVVISPCEKTYACVVAWRTAACQPATSASRLPSPIAGEKVVEPFRSWMTFLA